MSPDPDKYRGVRAAGTYAMIPAVLLAAPLVGFFMGRLLRSWLHTGQWIEIVMLMLGVLAGAREVARIIKRASKYD